MKKLLLGLLVLLSLAVVAVLVLPSLIDWNNHRGWVERRLAAYIGRDVAIEGDIQLSLLPTPILTADRVTLVDNQGDPLANIGAVDVRAGLLALLGGRLEIERLVVIDADLFLASEGVDVGALTTDPQLAEAVALSRVTVENGRLHWRDEAGETRLLADQIFAQMTAESLAGPFSLVGSVNLLGVDMTLDATSGSLSSGGAWPVSMTMELDGSDSAIRYSGLVGVDGRLQGDVEAEGSDLSRLMHAIRPDWPLPTDLAAPFAMEARLDGAAQGARLASLGLQVGESRATGSVAVSFDAVPTVEIDASVNRLDLAQWTSGDGAVVPDPLSGLVAPGVSIGLPRGVTIALEGRVGAIGQGEAPMRNVRLDALLSDGVVSVSRFTAQVPGGTDMRGVGTLSAEDGQPTVDAGLEVASGDLRRLLAWMGVDTTGIPTTRLRAFNARANLSGTPEAFSLSGLDLVVDSTRVTGGLAWQETGRTGFGLRLDIDTLNLDSYWPAVPATSAEAVAVARDWVVAHWPFLLTFDANLDVSVGRLAVAGSRLEDIGVDLTLSQGSLTIRDATIGSWEGDRLSARGTIGSVWPLEALDLAAGLSTANAAALADRLGLSLDWPLERLDMVDAQLRFLGGDESADVEFNGSLAGGQLLLGGTVQDPWQAPQLDVAARLTHDRALDVVHLIWPDYRPADELGSADLYARIVGPPQSVTLEDLTGQIGPTNLGGLVTVDLTGERPSISAELSANRVVLDRFLPASEPDFTAPGANRWSTNPFQTIDLGVMDGRLRLTASELIAFDQQLVDPSLDVALDDGALVLEAISARIFGGRLGASAEWRPGTRSELSFDIALAQADLATALDQGLGIEGLSGTLDASITAEGVGTSPADLVSRLTGEGLIAVRDGTAQGLDLAAASDRLATLEGPLEFLDVLRGPLSNGQTLFDTLNAPFDVAAGSLQADELRWRADAGLGTGGARFDLARLQLDAMVNIGFFDYPEAPPFGLRIFGPLSRLDRRLQADALQGWVATRAADAISTPEAPDTPPGEVAPLEEFDGGEDATQEEPATLGPEAPESPTPDGVDSPDGGANGAGEGADAAVPGAGDTGGADETSQTVPLNAVTGN